MRLDKAWMIAALAAAVAVNASGCIVEVTFDPIGRDASIAGSWTIDGAAPTQASCDAAGISRVRVRFFEGSDFRDHPDLVFNCADGAFDTRPNAVVADGIWTMSLIPIDASGAVVVTDPATPRETFDTIVVGGHIDLTPVDFGTPIAASQYAASWTLNGTTPDATNCGEAGIDEVWVEFLDSAGAPIAGATDRFPCTQGSFTSALDPGDYAVRVMAIDSADAPIAMLLREDFTLTAGTTHTLFMGAPIDILYDLFDPRGMDASLDAAWTVGTTAADNLSCEVAGGTTVEFVLYDPADTNREEGIVVAMAPCGAGMFGSTGNIIAAGSYLFSVVLVDAANVEVGRADFSEVTLAAGQELDATGTDLRLADTTLAFEIEWEYMSSLGSFGSCTDAGVQTILWDVTLNGATTPIYMSPTVTEACETLLVFNTASGEPITPGTYDLYIEGERTAGGKEWQLDVGASCQVVVSNEGDLGLTSSARDCRLRYMP